MKDLIQIAIIRNGETRIITGESREAWFQARVEVRKAIQFGSSWKFKTRCFEQSGKYGNCNCYAMEIG